MISTCFLFESVNNVKDIRTKSDMLTLLKDQGRSKHFFHVEDVIDVDNKMQTNYSYKLAAPIGKNFDPNFKPDLSPQQMLELGVFEGKYCNDQILEFPKEWFLKALKTNKLSPERSNLSCNLLGVKSRQSLQEWQRKGWIYGNDPRGWFEWYCRYYLGRREPSIDKIQIKRWKGVQRHLTQAKKYPTPKYKQLFTNWAYDYKKYLE